MERSEYLVVERQESMAKTEVVAGITTFLTMAYIIFVNPNMLALTGMDRGGVFVATILAAAIGTLVMGLVANIPYYITSAIIRRLLEAPVKPTRMVLTMQREVAARICAEPGDMSLLAVSVQLYGEPQIVARIPAGAFYPPPQVDSAVVRIAVGTEPAVTLGEGVSEQEFFRAVRAGFGQKRKTLRNSLKAGLALPAVEVEAALARAGVDPQRRAETLGLAEWAAVTNALHERRQYPQQDSNLRPTA